MTTDPQQVGTPPRRLEVMQRAIAGFALAFLLPGLLAACDGLGFSKTTKHRPLFGGVEPEATDLPISGLKLKFRSGFEEGVRLVSGSEGQSAELQGGDQGYEWDHLDHMFNYVAAGAVSKHLVDSRLTTERAHGGERSLYMALNVVDGEAQNRLQFEATDEEFGDEILTRRWLYFTDFGTFLNVTNDDVSIAGTREFALDGPKDFSIPLYIYREGGQLVWRVAGVDYANGPYWSQWTRPPRGFIADSKAIPVPKERWFRLDIYLKRHARDGVVKVWVDGQPLFDLSGVPTKREGSRWFTKIADYDGTKPGFIWVDDIEIYGR